MEVGLGKGHIVLHGTHLAPPQKKGTQQRQFLAHVCLSVVTKWLDGSRCHLLGR